MASFARALFGLNKPKRGPELTAPVIDDGSEMRRRRLAMQRMGLGMMKPSSGNRSGTLLTGPSGLQSQAPTARKSLLGD